MTDHCTGSPATCTWDEEHTHKTEWVTSDGDWPSKGRPVRVEHESGTIAVGTAGQMSSRGYQVLLASRSWAWLPIAGSTVFVPAPTTPSQPELPTEAGWYLDRYDCVWQKHNDGELTRLVNNDWQPERCAPFVRLEPRADTAKAVLSRLQEIKAEKPQQNLAAGIEQVAAEFGVTE